MLTIDGVSTPVWRLFEVPKFDRLTQNTEADVCVVGAGIAGLSTAYLLAKAGRNVVVVDAGVLAGGESERTTAHLTNILDKRYSQLEWLHGEHGARLAAMSHRAAIEKIESISDEEHIQCDFKRLDGYLFEPPRAEGDTLDQEWKAARRAGILVEFVDRAPLTSFHTGLCLRFPDQAQFHPLKYLAGLASAITRMGGRIFTETRVTSVSGGATPTVKTANQCQIQAAASVVATNTPINNRFAIHTKQAAYRTYVLGISVPKGSVPLGLYWDTADPYHYVRLHPEALHPEGSSQPDHDLLIVGGEDHKTGQDDDPEPRYARLEAWTRERFPMAAEIDFRWSGQVMEPVDGLAYIGRNPGDEHVYVVTGTSGNGMTYGTIAGMLLSDMILGQENPWAEIYNPSRITLRAAGGFLRENLNVAAWYTDYLTAGDVESAAAIDRDRGGVVRHGLSKMAIYRDHGGKLHELSAVCPHLGGIVHWNPAEQTWDCPLHGSRFDALGNVISGPATSDLKKAEEAES